MAIAARLPIAADRVGACVRTFIFRGIDLTGVTLGMQIRLRPDVPGSPLIDLATVADPAVQGLRLSGVATVGGIPESTVVLRITETTMKDATKIPYAGEPGSSSVLSYDMIGTFSGDKRRLVYGEFVAVPTTYGADAATPGTWTSSGGYTLWEAATLTFTGDTVQITIDGADLLARLVTAAEDARDAALETLADVVAAGEDAVGAIDDAVAAGLLVPPSAPVGVPAGRFELVGADGYPWFRASRNGKLETPQIDAMAQDVARLKAGSAQNPDFAQLAEYLHYIFYGQSLSVGYGALTGLSTTPLSYAKRAQAGVRSQDGGAVGATNWSSLVDLIETNIGANEGETCATGFAKMMRQLVLADTGVDLADGSVTRKMILSAPGKSAQSIRALGKGSPPYASGAYDVLTSDITNAKARVTALSATYSPQALLFIHGESDVLDGGGTPPGMYGYEMELLRKNVEALARSAAVADMTLPMVIAQMPTHLFYSRSTPYIALEQLRVAQTNPNICMALPHYFIPTPDGVHKDAVGYRWMGAYFALAVYNWIIKGGAKPVPLVPDKFQIIGNTILARFPVAKGKRLVIDTTGVPVNPTGKGFTVVNASNTAQTIAGVRIAGTDTIAITCSTTPVSGWKLRNAWVGNSTTGMSNIRDNSGDALIFDAAGDNKPMHNWTPIFEKVI